MKPIVVRAAHEVRSEFERVAEREESWYINRKNLAGLCARASYALVLALAAEGVEAELVLGRYDGKGHCWVEVAGHVVDVTATQFGTKRRVAVSKVGANKKYSEFARGDDALHLTETWPFEQQPQLHSPRAAT